jgi:hypothetical protein
MRDRRFSLSLDEETTVALRRLAGADERSMAAQLRYMIREAAMRRGLWEPSLKSVRRVN